MADGAGPLRRRRFAPVSIRRLWWMAVLGAVCVFLVVTLLAIGDPPGPSVVRVVGDDADLWAYTRERALLQGVETAWWVSRDGGITWSEQRPPAGIAGAGPQQEACNALACYRLVDERVIERRAEDGSTWKREHERPVDETPPAADQARRDWTEERSIAAVGGADLDVAAVATGHDGALVRADDGAWHSVAVTRPWGYRVRWWLAGIGCTLVLLGGLAVDVLLRHFTSQHGSNPSLPPLPAAGPEVDSNRRHR